MNELSILNNSIHDLYNALKKELLENKIKESCLILTELHCSDKIENIITFLFRFSLDYIHKNNIFIIYELHKELQYLKKKRNFNTKNDKKYRKKLFSFLIEICLSKKDDVINDILRTYFDNDNQVNKMNIKDPHTMYFILFSLSNTFVKIRDNTIETEILNLYKIIGFIHYFLKEYTETNEYKLIIKNIWFLLKKEIKYIYKDNEQLEKITLSKIILNLKDKLLKYKLILHIQLLFCSFSSRISNNIIEQYTHNSIISNYYSVIKQNKQKKVNQYITMMNNNNNQKHTSVIVNQIDSQTKEIIINGHRKKKRNKYKSKFKVSKK